MTGVQTCALPILALAVVVGLTATPAQADQPPAAYASAINRAAIAANLPIAYPAVVSNGSTGKTGCFYYSWFRLRTTGKLVRISASGPNVNVVTSTNIYYAP